MAVRFGKLFGNGAVFWANLQRSHDSAVTERTVDSLRDTWMNRQRPRRNHSSAAPEFIGPDGASLEP